MRLLAGLARSPASKVPFCFALTTSANGGKIDARSGGEAMRIISQRWLILAFLVVLGLGGVIFSPRPHTIKASGSDGTRVVTPRGEILKTPFDGLPATARYEWKKVSKATERRPACGRQGALSRPDRILVATGVESIAYAQPWCGCEYTYCAGQYECYDFTECDPCYGTVVNPDFECGPLNQGDQQDGTGCIDCPCGLCNRPLCMVL